MSLLKFRLFSLKTTFWIEHMVVYLLHSFPAVSLKMAKFPICTTYTFSGFDKLINWIRLKSYVSVYIIETRLHITELIYFQACYNIIPLHVACWNNFISSYEVKLVNKHLATISMHYS